MTWKETNQQINVDCDRDTLRITLYEARKGLFRRLFGKGSLPLPLVLHHRHCTHTVCGVVCVSTGIKGLIETVIALKRASPGIFDEDHDEHPLLVKTSEFLEKVLYPLPLSLSDAGSFSCCSCCVHAIVTHMSLLD